ncbi:MAG: T9SS type A sorting domain-containing protein [Cytophagales bacterium]|nr:T9SS type A sorting domain-containing protein [Cytophagales bacterium]
MKKTITKNRAIICGSFIAAMLLSNFGFAQQTIIFEDFSTAVVSTPPAGWDTLTQACDPAFDIWRFDNPFPRGFSAPIAVPFAIFDSKYNDCQHPVAACCGIICSCFLGRRVILESPVFNASLLDTVWLRWDQSLQIGAGDSIIVDVFNGTSWVRVWDTLSPGMGTPLDYSKLFNISDTVSGVSNAQVRFIFSALASGGDYYWIIDNVEISATSSLDIALTNASYSPQYTIVPLSQVQPIFFDAEVTNIGVDSAKSVTVNLETNLTPFDTITLGDLNTTGQIGTGTFTKTYTPGAIGTKTFDFMAEVANEPVAFTGDNSMTKTLEISDSVYARTDGTFDTINWCAFGCMAIMGNVFEVVNTDTITSVSIFLDAPATGDTTRVLIYDFNTIPSKSYAPDNFIVRTLDLVIPGVASQWYTLPIKGGSYVLDTGTYLIGVYERENSPGINIGYSSPLHIDSNAWVWTFFDSTWYPVEDPFWANWTGMHLIRANFATPPLPLVGTVSTITIPSCVGDCDGEVTVSVSGGTPPYTYWWNDTLNQTDTIADSLCAGTYMVVITDALFDVDTVMVVVNAPLPISLTVTQTASTICNPGDTVTLTAGGTGALSYSWSPNYNISATSGDTVDVYPLVDTTYTVIATDTIFGCTDTTTVSVTISAVPAVAGFTADVTQGCDSFTVQFTNTSGFAIGQMWTFTGGNPASSIMPNPSVIYNTPGSYDVTLKALGCAGDDSMTVSGLITVGTGVTAALTTDAAGDSVVINGTVVFTDTSSLGASTWNWNFGNGATPLTANTQGPHTVSYDSAGQSVIELIVSDGGFCADTTLSYTLTVYPMVGINELAGLKSLILSPNPTTGALNITYDINELKPTSIKIYNVIGELITEISKPGVLLKGEYNFDLSAQPDGAYFVKIESGDRVVTRKVSIIR